MALTSDLIFNYHLNSTGADASGNSNNLTLYGATYDTSIKKLGSASLNFDGIDDEAEADDSASLDLSTDFTFATWLYLTGLPSVQGQVATIFSKYGDHVGGTGRAYVWEINNSNDKMRVFFYDSSGNLTRFEMDTAFVAGDLNKWTSLWVEVDISVPSATFYKNNTLVSTTDLNTAATSIVNVAAKFRLGSRINSPPERFLKGKLDESAAWSVIKSSVDRDAYWNGGAGIEIGAAGFNPAWALKHSSGMIGGR